MILVIDADNARSRVGVAEDGVLRWTESGPRQVVTCLDGVARTLGARHPEGIAAVTGGHDRNATWSSVRATVAAANALAFAWGVPAVGIEAADDDGALAQRAHDAIAAAARGSRVSAVYDGKPNITTPRND